VSPSVNEVAAVDIQSHCGKSISNKHVAKSLVNFVASTGAKKRVSSSKGPRRIKIASNQTT
jgi:hypothetical protein